MANTTTYSMQAVSGTLDGLRMSAFWDGDDAVEVAPGVDVGTLTVGAAGDSIFSGSADHSATITIRLMHTSPTHRQLTQKWLQQRAGRNVPFPLDIVDSGSGEGGTAEQCFIMTAPTDTKGKVATVREWVLVTGEWTPTVPNAA